jgi:hypothetical protein
MARDTEDEVEVGVEIDEAEGSADVATFAHAVNRGTPRERKNPIHDDQGCVRSCDLMAMPPSNFVPQGRPESFSEKFNFPRRMRRGQWTPSDLGLKCLFFGKLLRCNNLSGYIAERLTSPYRFGCRFLGMYYDSGECVEKNVVLFTSLFHNACDAGDENSCARLKPQQ